MVRMMAARVARCHRLCYEFAAETLRERVAAALMRIAEDCGVDHAAGTLIDRHICQHEIARIVGASRPRVSLAPRQTGATDPRAGSPNGSGALTNVRGDWHETMSSHWFP